MPFQFVEFPELNDIKVALGDALLTGWTEMITADPANFEAEWQEFLDEWAAAGGDERVQAYQNYYDANLRQGCLARGTFEGCQLCVASL